MGQKDVVIQHYLQEGMVALLPGYREGEDGGTQVYTLQGAHHDPRSLPWLVEVLAHFYRLDLAAVRRHTGRLLELSHHIPLPLAEGLILLPVKVRQAAALGENTTGYVNLIQVEGVEAVGGGNGNGGNGANGENGETSEINGGSPDGAGPSSGETIMDRFCVSKESDIEGVAHPVIRLALEYIGWYYTLDGEMLMMGKC